MKTILPALLMATLLLSLACRSADSAGVASLERNDDTAEAVTTVDGGETAGDAVAAQEAAVMAFTECMREEGIEFEDPLVDSDGNVQRPQLVAGATITRDELAGPYATCGEHLEGLTFGRERPDESELVDQLITLAECLRGKGCEMDDPTAETLQDWRIQLRQEFDWDDPAAQAAYADCNEATEVRQPRGRTPLP